MTPSQRSSAAEDAATRALLPGRQIVCNGLYIHPAGNVLALFLPLAPEAHAETIRAWITTHPIVGADPLFSPLEHVDGGPDVALGY